MLSLGIIRISIEGSPDPQTRIYASNSLSILDYLVHFFAAPITIITNSDVPGIERFLLGSLFDSCPRERPRKRNKTAGKSRYQICDVASDPSYFPLLLFPEGVPTTGDAIIRFDPDCFATDYPIQPVALQYCLGLTPRGFNSIHPGKGTIFGALYRLLSVPWITVTVSYVQAEKPKGQGHEKETAMVCQMAIANRIGVMAVSKGIEKAKKDGI